MHKIQYINLRYMLFVVQVLLKKISSDLVCAHLHGSWNDIDIEIVRVEENLLDFRCKLIPSQALRVEFTEALIFRAILLHSINASVAMLKQQNGFQCLAFMYIGNDVLNRGTRLMLVYYTAQFLLTFSTSFSSFFFASSAPSPTSFRNVHYYWRNGMGSALNVHSEKHKFAKAKE